MFSWKGMEPKTVVVVVYRAIGVQTQGKGKYMIAFGTGKKKQLQSGVEEDATGNPQFNTEAEVRVTDISDPVVIQLRDKKFQCGQVLIPIKDIPAKPENVTDAKSYFPKKIEDLEPTKKQSNPKGRLEYAIWVSELRPISSKEKSTGSGLKAFLSRSNLRRQSGSQLSIKDISLSTPHLLQANGSFHSAASSSSSKAKKGFPRFKIGKRKTSRASSRSDLDSIDFNGVAGSTRSGGGSIYDDGASSISGMSLDERHAPPPVPPHAGGALDSSFGMSRPFNPRGSDPFAGRNPFETSEGTETTEYRGQNPFEEDDTTDLDVLNSMTENQSAQLPSISRHGSSSGSEYSLDDGGSPRHMMSIPRLTTTAPSPDTRRARNENGVSLEAVAAAVAEEKPVILSVEPMEAAVEGTSVIHIEGRYLAKGASDVESVYLADCELKGDNIQYLTSSKIKVFTRRWYPNRGPIFIKTYSGGKITFEGKEFTFGDGTRKSGSKPSVRTSSFTSGYRSHSREVCSRSVEEAENEHEKNEDEDVFNVEEEWNEQIWLQRAGLASRKSSVDRQAEPSNVSDTNGVNSTGKRYRKATRCMSNTSQSMHHLADADDLHNGDLPRQAPTQPKIKSSGTKSPGGSLSKSWANRFSKSVSDLAQNTLTVPPFRHKRQSSKGDLADVFNETGDINSGSKSRNNSTKKKASACAARIERKNEPTPVGSNFSSAVSTSALEEENKRLQNEMDALKDEIDELKKINSELLTEKKARDDRIDELIAVLIENDQLHHLCIDNKTARKSTKIHGNGSVRST